MKITKVEVFRLPTANSKQNSPIGCRIHTDVGICGDGETGMAYGVGGSGAFGMVCDLAELIIGMDPLRTEFIWETMYKRTFWGQNGGPVVFSGIAAIDVALWDIKGKYFNVPCYQLLGGKVRDKLRTYASQLQFGWGQVGVSEHLWAVTPRITHTTSSWHWTKALTRSRSISLIVMKKVSPSTSWIPPAC